MVSRLLFKQLFAGRETIGDLEITLDCSIGLFRTNEISREHAIILLSDLMHLAGRKFEMDLETHDIFHNDKVGKESGEIEVEDIESIYEEERRVESAAICLSFLFFSNVLGTRLWSPTSRRGEHWDYWCLDENGSKNVIEVGGSSIANGARRDHVKKRNRFDSGPERSEPTYISSVGFADSDHIVSRYC